MDSMTGAPASAQPQQKQQQQPPQQQRGKVVPSGGPQVRSRITLVCAECKRLKLKCDRKTPCGSCEKRDTVVRCIYSPAAAEKVDLHSLNNRLTAVEAQLSRTGSGGRSCNHHGGSGSGLPLKDRALIAVGSSGSSLAIALHDVTFIWLDLFDLNKDLAITPSNPFHSLSFTPYSPLQIKLEPNSVPLYSNANSVYELPAALLVPPPSIYYPTNSPTCQPSVTTGLVALLPSSSSRRRKFCNSVEEILTINPCFSWKHFRERLDGIFGWAADMEFEFESGDNSSPTYASKSDSARAIFFGKPMSGRIHEPKPTVSFFAAVAAALAVGAQAHRDQRCGNDANEDGDMAVDDVLSNDGILPGRGSGVVSSNHGKKARTTPSTKLYPSLNMSTPSPAMLFALSKQALDIFENSGAYDLDCILALIMQALYMLHDGKPVVDHRLYPLVGKMVSVARTMGLEMDPDEFPGRYTLFEAETRRRIWWNVYCYDLYVSDSMGHPPVISDHSFTTRMPVDVDENEFLSSSTSIPTPTADDHASRYFGLKLRMAQIAKSVKRRTFKDPLTDSPASIEEASSFEGEVTQFFSDLPLAFKLDFDANPSTIAASVSPPSLFSTNSPDGSSSSACLIAQQCELAITGQSLIVKIYLPFLRSNQSSVTCNASHYQASVNTINAAHAIIRASKVLHAICKQPPGAHSQRPGPAIFDYYSFGRALFDAAVVCAQSVILQPNAIWARVALDDVIGALEVMKDPVVATGRSSIQASVEGVSEPVKIIESLKKAADCSRKGSHSSPNSGSKRKHSEIGSDVNFLAPGFRLPYAGAAVALVVSAIRSPSSSVLGSSPVDGARSDSDVLGNGSESSGTKRPDSEKTRVKNKEKKTSYPMVGIRVRPGKEIPVSITQRERTHSTVLTSSFIEPDARMQSSASVPSNQSVSHLSSPTPVPNNHHSFSIPVTQEPSSTYQPPPSADSMRPPMQQDLAPNSHTDYSSSFTNADNGSSHMTLPPRHKFTIHEVSAQHGYTTGTPNQMSDRQWSNSFNNAPNPAFYRPGSSGQFSTGSSSDGGGLVGMPSQHLFTPFAHSQDSYKPPVTNPPSTYFAPQPYQSNFDNGPQVDLNLPFSMPMDNSGGMTGSHTALSNDMIFDVKQQSGNSLQQLFGNVQGQGHGWRQDNGGSGNGAQLWQPDYKVYYST